MLAGTFSWWYAHFNPLLHYRWMSWLDAIIPDLSESWNADPMRLATTATLFLLYGLLIGVTSRRTNSL